MDARLLSVSVGCNKVANCLDWGPTGLLAYGAHDQVIIYDDQVRFGSSRAASQWTVFTAF